MQAATVCSFDTVWTDKCLPASQSMRNILSHQHYDSTLYDSTLNDSNVLERCRCTMRLVHMAILACVNVKDSKIQIEVMLTVQQIHVSWHTRQKHVHDRRRKNIPIEPVVLTSSVSLI